MSKFFPFMTSKKRRQVLINKEFQFKYIGRVFWFTVVMIIIGGIFAFLFISFLFMQLEQDAFVTEYPLVIKAIFATIAIQVLLTGVFVYWEGLYITHKIVGPWVRIKRFLEDVGKGNFSLRLNLRSADEFQDVAKWINEMCDNLERLHIEGKLCPPKENNGE